jgi:hypothetical protein
VHRPGLIIRSNSGWSASEGWADEGALGGLVGIRREPVATWRAGLLRANTVVIISITLGLLLERQCVRFLTHLNPVLCRTSQSVR